MIAGVCAAEDELLGSVDEVNHPGSVRVCGQTGLLTEHAVAGVLGRHPFKEGAIDITGRPPLLVTRRPYVDLEAGCGETTDPGGGLIGDTPGEEEYWLGLVAHPVEVLAVRCVP